ncbi:MAG: hypothetical protein IPK99_17060 [Flavobacteriales bacterium]|nr:hypothetical protein [Flavobacteriales bacterium]
MELYKYVNDSVDSDAAAILADWARSLSDRKEWASSNYMLRYAIALCGSDSADKSKDTRWIKYRLRLVKNLITTDSLVLAERTLGPCLTTSHSDSLLHCEVLLVKGALLYKQNMFRSADTTLQQAVDCLSALSNDGTKAVRFLSGAT